MNGGIREEGVLVGEKKEKGDEIKRLKCVIFKLKTIGLSRQARGYHWL